MRQIVPACPVHNQTLFVHSALISAPHAFVAELGLHSCQPPALQHLVDKAPVLGLHNGEGQRKTAHSTIRKRDVSRGEIEAEVSGASPPQV